MEGEGEQLLFVYDTLRFGDVQLDIFGRVVASVEAVLPACTIDYVDIADRRSGDAPALSVHPVLRHTGDAVDKVVGRVLRLSLAELDAADEYEAPLYRRAQLPLADGRAAWVYVG